MGGERHRIMKRLGKLFDKICSIDNGILAVINGTRNKRGKNEVSKLLYDEQIIDQHPELWHMIDTKKARKYIEPICEKLYNKTWKHSAPKHRRQFCESSYGGKWRELYIPKLEDHLVHHMLMQVTMEAFTKGMHPHCCGSVPGRGIKHIAHWVKYWMFNDEQCRYFVKLDIKNFFPSIDKDILFSIIKTKIKDKYALDLFWQILCSAPDACPIGYYPSPWLSNLYLEKFDWYVEQQLYKERRGKRIKYVRHYLRYADDMLLIGTSKKDLEKSVQLIKKYLKDNLKLDIKNTWKIKAIGKHEIINRKWKLKPGTYWCDIGGYKFCKDSMVLRDSVFLKIRRQKQRKYTNEDITRNINVDLQKLELHGREWQNHRTYQKKKLDHI